MWHFLKSELDYYKWLLLPSILLVVLINIGLTVDDRWIEAQGDFPGLRVIWLGIGIVVYFFMLLFSKRSGRYRTFNLLPVKGIKISIIRWLPFTIFWFTTFFILVIFFLINLETQPNVNWYLNFIRLTGIMVFINAIPTLYADFINTYFKMWEKLILGLIWIIFFLCYIYLNIIFSTYLDFLAPEFIISSRESITNIYFADSMSIVSIFWGFLMFLLTLHSFRKRKLYLE